jgi:hypothetical protein
MRICLMARNNFVDDPRARALRTSLCEAGHEVDVVAVGVRPPAAPERATYVAARWPAHAGLIGRGLRRVQPQVLRQRLLDHALSKAAAKLGPQILHPTSPTMIRAATRATGERAAVARDPRWPDAGQRDLVQLAPGCPELSASAAGPGVPFHTPSDDRPPTRPEPGRYVGQRIAIAYPQTDTNPGRYLEDALHRAGFEVLRFTKRIQTNELPTDLRALIFVEGPYPPIEVTGPSVSFPVLFWVHHGEHHLPANLRIARQYRADGVLLAHSWHLAHRFHVPVHRFPFGIDEQLFDPSVPWKDRPFDVAMVGAHLRTGGPYQRRQAIVRQAEAAIGSTRSAFLEGVTPAEMAETYGRSRIILNEGGTRHFPITMRVFEAVAAGALLLTDPVPGLDQLFRPGRDYLVIEDDLGRQLQRTLADPSSSEIASSAHERARGHHTYDHRVDELMAVVQVTEAGSQPSASFGRSECAASLLHEDIEIQRVLTDGIDIRPDELPDREIWLTDQLPREPGPGTYEAVVAHVDEVDDDPVLLAARKFLYLTGHCGGLEGFLERHHPHATVCRHGEVLRFDLKADSYRMDSREGRRP